MKYIAYNPNSDTHILCVIASYRGHLAKNAALAVDHRPLARSLHRYIFTENELDKLLE
jgi:hypothetical protein